MYYGFRLLLKVQYSGDQLYECESKGGCRSLQSSPTFDMVDLNGGMEEVWILLAMAIGYRICAYFCLRRRITISNMWMYNFHLVWIPLRNQSSTTFPNCRGSNQERNFGVGLGDCTMIISTFFHPSFQAMKLLAWQWKSKVNNWVRLRNIRSQKHKLYMACFIDLWDSPPMS